MVTVMTEKIKTTAGQKVLGEFLETIYEELSAAINNIRNTARVLASSHLILSEEDRKLVLSQIITESEKLNSSITNLIELSRLLDDYKLLIKPCNLSDLIRERVDFCKEKYVTYDEEKNPELVQFVLSMEKNVFVDCDKYYISRVLDNVIADAIENRSKGKINVKLHRKTNGLVEIAVINDSFVLKKIVHGSLKPVPVSFANHMIEGVRFLFCKEVIKAHNGHIWANTIKNKGASFTFTLSLSRSGKQKNIQAYESGNSKVLV